VFVKPEMRHRGIASAMLQEAAAIARRADVKDLYIDCLGATAPVLRKGWLEDLRAGSWGQRLGRYASSDKMMLRMTAEPDVYWTI
jgi:GNAT superfamily N-acetyltransferase